MLNVDDIQGLEVRKFCGLPIEQSGEYTMMCVNEAVGELTAEVDGASINVPVCRTHLEIFAESGITIESFDNAGATLLD